MSAVSASPLVGERLAAPRLSVTRSPGKWATAGSVGVSAGGLAVLALLPLFAGQGFQTNLVNLFVLVCVATMWNALAGYAGLVSVGQQLYIGAGAYTVLVLAQHGFDPFVAVPVALVFAVVLAVPCSFLVFRLSGAYFAIATWVLAQVAMLFVERFTSLGGGTGAPVPGLDTFGPTDLLHYTYWTALALTALALASVYALLRSRTGLVLTSVRDNEVGARSAGARVTWAKRAVYVLAAVGCAAAGTVLALSQLDVEPGNVFNVQWTAYMIFAVLIGGLGTIEGPVVGAVIFFVLQQALAQYNAWYLIILGSVAMGMAIWARRGVWGTLVWRVPLHLFPLGYRVFPRGREGK